MTTEDTAPLFAAFTLSQLADRFGVGVRAVNRWKQAGIPPRYQYIARRLLAELDGTPDTSDTSGRVLTTGPKGPVTVPDSLADLESARWYAALTLREAARQLGIAPAYLARIEQMVTDGAPVRVAPELADRIDRQVLEWRRDAVLTPRRVRFALRGLGWTTREIATHLSVPLETARAWRLGQIGKVRPSARQLRLLGLGADGAFLTPEDKPRTFWEAVCRTGGVREVLRRSPEMTPAKLRALVIAPPTMDDMLRLVVTLGQDETTVLGWWGTPGAQEVSDGE